MIEQVNIRTALRIMIERMDLLCILKKSIGRKHKSKGKSCMNWEGSTFLDSERFWKEKKIKESIYINAYDASNGLKGLMNLEKGCKIDPCWNKFNHVIRYQAEKMRSNQREKSGLGRPLPRIYAEA